MFGGYQRYLWLRKIWRSVGRVPRALRGPLFRAIQCVPPQLLNRWGDVAQTFRAPARRYQLIGDKLHKLSAAAAVNSPVEVYERLISLWKDSQRAVLGADVDVRTISQNATYRDLEQFTEEMMVIDASAYLPDDVLVKVDRASMAVSLEARAPLLDHRLFEFAARLPLHFKIQGNEGKRILRSLLFELVPRELVDRSKTGFGVPIGDWLRGPLREWANDLLSPESLARDGFLDPIVVQRIWQEHLSGRRQWQYQLWAVLMFNAWLHEHTKQSVTAERTGYERRISSVR